MCQRTPDIAILCLSGAGLAASRGLVGRRGGWFACAATYLAGMGRPRMCTKPQWKRRPCSFLKAYGTDQLLQSLLLREHWQA
jgi:hypothetical protein